MEISFNTKKIEKLCNSHQDACTKLGQKCAKALRNRLVGLSAIEVLGGFRSGHLHPLKGNKKDQFSIELYSAYRLVFKAIEPIPKTNDDAIDWQNVKQITIIFIGDYHE